MLEYYDFPQILKFRLDGEDRIAIGLEEYIILENGEAVLITDFLAENEIFGLEEVEWFDLTEMILSNEGIVDSTEVVDMVEWYDIPTMMALKDPFLFHGEVTEEDRRTLGAIALKNSLILSDDGSVVLTTNYLEKVANEPGIEHPTVEEIEVATVPAEQATTWSLRRTIAQPQLGQVTQLPWINLKQIII